VTELSNNIVKSLRKTVKMSQSELATRSNVSRTYIALIETGKRENPSHEVMGKIALALGKTISEIFFPNESESKKRKLFF
jgi:transcriptional regulator with XRE-family HTH domain